MKKKDVINLIRYHTENNEPAFRNEAYRIAQEFSQAGDERLAEYIVALLSDANVLVPQSATPTKDFRFLIKYDAVKTSLPLPATITDELQGILNAIGRNIGSHRFLFQGPAGTGKTESVKQLTAILQRELYVVDFNLIIDSKLGQTAKNISQLFTEINSFAQPDRVVVLFDEIDALALDRINSRDVREMGRATSALLRQLDDLSSQIVLFATTNLFASFDQAFLRRFDYCVDFGQYTREDLEDVATNIMNSYADQYSFIGRNIRFFKKIIALSKELPYPGEMQNLIKSSVAFSKTNEPYDYLRRLYIGLVPDGAKHIESVADLRKQGFTMREIEILTGISRSSVGRELKGEEQ